MKRIIIFLLPIIGFSQNCENPILDEVLQNENVNQYFQLALSFNISDLAYLNDCDSDTSYTMFVPGNNVPTESTSTILTLPGDLIDYISYYVHVGDLSLNQLEDLNGSTIEMMDQNFASINYYDGPFINNAMIETGDICTCNGTIHIINDLIWADNIQIEEHVPITHHYNPIQKTIQINTHLNSGKLNLTDLNGKIVNTQEINSNNIEIYGIKTGLYFISYIDRNKVYTKKILIN